MYNKVPLFSHHFRYVENYVLCCCFVSQARCHSPNKVYRFFDCGTLLSPYSLSVACAAVGVLVFLFNSLVLYSRSRHVFYGKESKQPDVFRVQSLLIWNLGLSGFLMSVYLLSLLLANFVVYGNAHAFYFKSSEWVNSAQCLMSGFLYFVSLESSILFLVFLSVDQYIKFRFSDTGKRISFRVAVYGSSGVWGFAFFTGLLGALALPSNSDFHDLSRLCIGLPIFWRPGGLDVRNNTINPLQLPFGIIIVLFNLLCFVPLVYCYTYVNRELKKIHKKEKELKEERSRQRKEEKERRKKEKALNGIENPVDGGEDKPGLETSDFPANCDERSHSQDSTQQDSETDVNEGLEISNETGEKSASLKVFISEDSTQKDDETEGNGETTVADHAGDKHKASKLTTNGDILSQGSKRQDNERVGNGEIIVTNHTRNKSEVSEYITNGVILSQVQDNIGHDDKTDGNEEKTVANHAGVEASNAITNGDIPSQLQDNTGQDGATDRIGETTLPNATEDGSADAANGVASPQPPENTKQDDEVSHVSDDGDDPEQKLIRLAKCVKAILILSCFIYVPVFILAFFSQCRVPIPAIFYRPVMVTLLPMCSAINPIIYLILSVNYESNKPPPDMDTSELAEIQCKRQFEIMGII